MKRIPVEALGEIMLHPEVFMPSDPAERAAYERFVMVAAYVVVTMSSLYPSRLSLVS